MLTVDKVKSMWYVDFMASLNEINRCPWWIDSVRKTVLNSFISSYSHVLDVWCNTGYVSFEIARLAWCKVTWVDINENMIEKAMEHNNDITTRDLVDFQVWDWMNLKFNDNVFDLVVSGGSSIFMDDMKKWLFEYKRVCKDWWFIADINFFYTDKVPSGTIQEINWLLWINIQPWKKDYFLRLYEQAGLERFYVSLEETYNPTENEMEDYCKKMIDDSVYSQVWKEVRIAAYNKLYGYMKLFVENNKYLSYWVFIYRKTPQQQVSLF